MAFVAAGIGPGDEVIVPTLTFVATANAVLYTGATVVLADVTSAEDLTISVDDVIRKFTPRTRAVVPVHYAGQPCDMIRLRRECSLRGVAIIEDNAHGPLADAWMDEEGRVQALGTIGEIGCFSFFSNKNMATGEGGMVVTRDKQLADKLRLLRSHGMTTLTLERHRGHAYSYDVVEEGFNYRIDELRAALGISQLARLCGEQPQARRSRRGLPATLARSAGRGRAIRRSTAARPHCASHYADSAARRCAPPCGAGSDERSRRANIAALSAGPLVYPPPAQRSGAQGRSATG